MAPDKQGPADIYIYIYIYIYVYKYGSIIANRLGRPEAIFLEELADLLGGSGMPPQEQKKRTLF